MRTSRIRLLLICLILLGFALRLFMLGEQSLWYDEGVTATIAQRDLGTLTRWTANDIQPPLYYYLVAGWGRLAGWSEWALRFPSAFFAVLALPLLAMVGFRLTRLPGAAWLAVLLAAFHPLLVYYGQEARMYMLLVCLSVFLAYLLLRIGDSPGPAWPLWLAYVLAATAAVYTHYFAFFLLAGLACAWLLERPGRSRVLRFAGANLAMLVLYLPWFTILLTQLRVDRSYWLGDFKLHEALLDVAISFTSGETMPEHLALWLLAGYAVVTLAAFGGVAKLWPQTRRLVLYAGCWLLVPVLAVLALALNVPKFNARYVMLALPALLLVWAGGLAALAAGTVRRDKESAGTLVTGRPRLPLVSAAICVALVLGGAIWSNWNWFFNPSFAKDNWRQITEFLRTRTAPDEQIVLVSGHAWPVWDYYAADLPVVRLPDLEILDVDAVLDFANTQPALAAAFAAEHGKRGAWLVNWQDEVVDPDQVVPVQLELGGREKGQSATFNGLSLRRFGGIRASRFVAEPPVDHVMDVSFGGEVVLHGYTVLNNGDLLLFWQRQAGEENAGPDLHMALQTSTIDGQPLARPQDRRLAGYTYPSFRWPAGATVMGHVPAGDWLGANPANGTVQVDLRVYDGADPAATPLQTEGGESQLTLRQVEVVID